MIVINYSTAFNALDHYVKNYNASRDQLSEQIRQSASATAKDIIRIYGLSLTKANGVEEIDADHLPSLRTNNIQLAKKTGASARTIQRHIQRLQDAGIITNKIWHGTNASYELWINPKILLVKKKMTLEEAKMGLEATLKESLENEQKAKILENQTPICLHTDTGNNGYNNNLIKAVDNSENSIQPAPSGNDTGYNSGDNLKRCSLSLTVKNDFTGYNITGYTGKKVAKKNKDAGEKGRERRAENQNFGEVKSPELDPARSASLNLYVLLLWSLAKNVLYKNTYLTKRQIEIGKKLLYQWYEPVATENLPDVHQIYVERIGLVRKYIQKDPKKRFVQLPNLYFDPYNPTGFAGTKKWLKAHKKRKVEVRSKLIVHAQIRRFLNNGKKEAKYQKPPLQLYRECETRVGKLRDPALLKQFHMAVLDNDINQQLCLHY